MGIVMPPERKVLPQITNAIDQVRKDLTDAMGELAYHVKADFIHDREQLRLLHNENVEIRSRLDDLEQRFNLYDSH
jgi:hypothetical protein